MFEALFLLVMFFGALPILGWLMGIAFRVFGWTIRAMLSLFLAPILILGFVFTGIIGLLPIALVVLAFSMRATD